MKAHPQLEARIRIGARLRALREEHRLTQQDIADKTGIASQTVSKIESGKWSFGFDLLEVYAKVFDMKIDVK